MRCFMIRAGENSRLYNKFKDLNIVAIGWNDIVEIDILRDKEKLKRTMETLYPENKKQKNSMWAGQLYRFVNLIRIDDYVITYNSQNREYSVGKIISDYRLEKIEDFDYNHVRSVEWIGDFSRDNLKTKSKNSLGSISTIFQLTGDVMYDIFTQAKIEFDENLMEESDDIDDEPSLNILKEDFQEKAHEFIKDKIISMDWETSQELVAALLRAMGYKTRISPKGSDRGKDIIASFDGLGISKPVVAVEVKNQKGKIGAPDIRNFITAAQNYDTAIYVSFSGFTTDAIYQADNSAVAPILIDSNYLVSLILDNYDNFDNEGKAILPLRKVYWPQD